MILFEAAFNGRWDTIRLRLTVERDGYDGNLRDGEGNTLLHYAAVEGSVKIMDHLTERGSDINSTKGDGSTALHMAAQYECFPTVKHLLKNETNNVKNLF